MIPETNHEYFWIGLQDWGLGFGFGFGVGVGVGVGVGGLLGLMTLLIRSLSGSATRGCVCVSVGCCRANGVGLG